MPLLSIITFIFLLILNFIFFIQLAEKVEETKTRLDQVEERSRKNVDSIHDTNINIRKLSAGVYHSEYISAKHILREAYPATIFFEDMYFEGIDGNVVTLFVRGLQADLLLWESFKVDTEKRIISK